ncbi:hypothetical protein ACFQX8_17095 [Klenkia terrae]
MTRRPLAALATAALALTLTACGSSDEETPAAGGPRRPTAPSR